VVASDADAAASQDVVEFILGAADLRLLGGRGGVSREAWARAVGRPVAELLDAAHAALIGEIGEQDGPHQLSLDLKLDGRELPLVVELARLGACIVVRGVPRQAVGEVVSEAQLVQHRLEELGILVSGIAHDFNNILSAILGNAEFLAEAIAEISSGGSDLRAAVADITTAAERSRELIAQMLGYAAKRRGGVRAALDVSAITVEMARLLRASIPPRISLHFAIRDDLPPAIGDASQLRQVIMNLIVNAADAIADVGTITIRSGTMYADATLLATGHAASEAAEGDYVFVEFEDTGCGMSAATLARIFDPFFTTKSKGRGLGLAGVRSIITGHGGCLLVASTPGMGTTFRILLPVGSLAPRSLDEGSPASTQTLDGLRVLVIDDESMILRVSVRVLTARGAQVMTATDGHQGLELFAAAAQGFDCVLLNVAMPFIDGIEVAHELRTLRDDLPILFVSGYGRDEIERRIAGFTRVAFLEKPFTSGRLIAGLHALLEHAKVRAGSPDADLGP